MTISNLLENISSVCSGIITINYFTIPFTFKKLKAATVKPLHKTLDVLNWTFAPFMYCAGIYHIIVIIHSFYPISSIEDIKNVINIIMAGVVCCTLGKFIHTTIFSKK